MGPIAAMGVACAALSMLTLLPALLTIFGRRAFWPFVPHSTRVDGARGRDARGACAAGSSRARASARCFRCSAERSWSFILLPLVILNALLTRLTRGLVPSLILGPLDRALFKPYEVRRFRHERIADETHGFWSRVGQRVARHPARVAIGSVAVLLLFCTGLAFFSTDLTTNDSYRTKVEAVEGQDLLSKSFPAGASAPTDIVVPSAGEVAGGHAARSRASTASSRSRGRSPRATPGVLIQATLEPQPYSTEAFDLIEPIRDAAHRAAQGTLVGGATAVEFDVREAAAWDSAVIPPIVLVVVFLILVAAAAGGRRAAHPDRDGDPQLRGRARASATSSSTSSSTSPARTRRCRCSRSSSSWRWAWTTTSS